jgi:hypothetical protein
MALKTLQNVDGEGDESIGKWKGSAVFFASVVGAQSLGAEGRAGQGSQSYTTKHSTKVSRRCHAG